jgi:hypothetical protein
MTQISIVQAASRDAYPALLAGLEALFGREASVAIASDYLAAELADFHWESRVAERWLGTCERGGEGEDSELERIAIVGLLQGTWFVATCLVDGDGAVDALQNLALAADENAAARAFDALR